MAKGGVRGREKGKQKGGRGARDKLEDSAVQLPWFALKIFINFVHNGCGSTRTEHQCNTAVKPDVVLNGVTVARSHLQVNSGVRSTSVDRSITLQQEGINVVIAILIVISANNQCSVWEIFFWSSKSRVWVVGQRIIGYSAPDLARIPQRRAACVARRWPAICMFPWLQFFVQNMLKNFQVSRRTFDEIWSVRTAVR